jgi:hypothetical protein
MKSISIVLLSGSAVRPSLNALNDNCSARRHSFLPFILGSWGHESFHLALATSALQPLDSGVAR